jgi:nucleoid-associated protein YgaU
MALLILLALLAGLPWLLWHATAAAADSGIEDLQHLFSRSDTSGAFFLALAAVGWIGWAGFALSVLVEIPAQLRGRATPRLPGLRLGQRTAATLIGAIVVLLPAGTAMASPTALSVSVSTGQVPQAGAERSSAETAEGQKSATVSNSAAPRQQREYTVREVRPAESLWQIAEKELGSGEDFAAIIDLNEGRMMPDGRVFSADAVLQPGWTLLLPASSAPQGNHPEPQAVGRSVLDSDGATAAAESYTVRPGDYLSKIARDELGNGDRWPELYEANRDRIADPDLIRPGQKLDLPQASAGNAARDDDERRDEPERDSNAESPADPGPSNTAPPPSDRPETENDSKTPTPRHEESLPSREPAASAPGPAASPSHQPSTTAADVPVSKHQDASLLRQAALAGGIGALLAASLTGALAVKRVLQQRRRRAGETIAIEEPTAAEQIAQVSGTPSGVTLLDTALRALISHAEEAGNGLPAIRGARVTESSVVLLPDDPTASAPKPFVSGETRGTWVLEPNAPLEYVEPTSVQPYPSLVTLGATLNGDLLLADLLHARALLLDGAADDVLAVCRALALEAGTNQWSRHSEILTVGLGQRLATLLPKGRIRAMPHLSAVTADIGELLLELHQHQDDPGAMAHPLPWILISASDIDAEEAWQLADAVSAARGLEICVVLPATDDTRRAFPEALEIDAAPDASVALPHLAAEPIRLQRLTDAQYQQYVHALEISEAPAEPATGAWQDVHDHASTAASPVVAAGWGSQDPSDPFPALLASVRAPAPRAESVEPADAVPPAENDCPQEDAASAEPPELSEGAPQGPYIEVMGPLRIRELDSSGQALKVAVLAALIHLRPGRTAAWLCEAMDPVSPWSLHTLQNRLTEIRNRLGSTADGRPYLPRPKSGYAFRPEVSSDWQRFQLLAEQGLTAGSPTGIPYLEAALGLVRGRPFDDGAYPWAAPIQQEMLSRIVDIAHTLASWHSNSDRPDLDAARRAVLRGLDVDESAEVLHRDRISIEQAAGNSRGLRKAVDRVRTVAHTYDIALDPLTEQSIAQALASEDAPTLVSHTDG